MSNTANVTLRLPTDLLERIDNAARQRGLSRTEYMVSWLPVRYDSTAQTSQNTASRQRRASRPAGESSSSRADTDA